MAIIISREGFSKNAETAARGCLKENGKLIIDITDNDLIQMINIKDDDKVIDVGCDHALLDVYLVKNNIVKNIIVSDVSKNALDSGISNIKKFLDG